jgi:flagellar hook-basal body complex protein FliE
MNPLSALRTLAYPALHSGAPAQALAESAAPKTIPFTELEKLSPGILPNPVGVTNTAPAGFDKLVTGLVNEVSAKQAASSEAVNGLLSGQNVSLHQTMIAMEEASISFQLMVEVRNKLLESYQELMRMQI